MTQGISPGVVPPRPGLEKEEPELVNEDDIPKDDRGAAADPHDTQQRPAKDVERE
jgi:hypothetical protein